MCIEELRRNIRKSVLDLSAYFKFSLHSLNSDIMRGETGILMIEDMIPDCVIREHYFSAI